MRAMAIESKILEGEPQIDQVAASRSISKSKA
jgi:hypothetical protein